MKRFFSLESSRKRAIVLLKFESLLLLGIVIYLLVAPLISTVSVPAALSAEIVFGALGAAGLWGCAIGFQKARSFGRAPAVHHQPGQHGHARRCARPVVADPGDERQEADLLHQ